MLMTMNLCVLDQHMPAILYACMKLAIRALLGLAFATLVDAFSISIVRYAVHRQMLLPVQGLAAALENGAAPELISLNLRDNPIGMDGEDVLVRNGWQPLSGTV